MNLRLSGTPSVSAAWVERIDEEHANARPLWQTMRAPEYLSASQIEQIETASVLRKEPHPWTYKAGNADLVVALPPQSVATITIEFGHS